MMCLALALFAASRPPWSPDFSSHDTTRTTIAYAMTSNSSLLTARFS